MLRITRHDSMEMTCEESFILFTESRDFDHAKNGNKNNELLPPQVNKIQKNSKKPTKQQTATTPKQHQKTKTAIIARKNVPVNICWSSA